MWLISEACPPAYGSLIVWCESLRMSFQHTSTKSLLYNCTGDTSGYSPIQPNRLTAQINKLCSESLVLRNHGFQGWRHDVVKICDMWRNPHQRLFHLSLELPFNLLQIGINLCSDFWFRACVRLSGDYYYQYQEGKPCRDASEQHVWSFACVSKRTLQFAFIRGAYR